MLRRNQSYSPRLNLRSQSGQIAVVVFLIMAVLLVIGLSLATRTTREIELAGQQEDTTRVFNAAETGVEAALSDENNFKSGVSVSPSVTENFNEAKVTTNINAQDTFDKPVLRPGETATVYTNSAGGNIKISWGKSTVNNCANIAALVVSIYYMDSGSYRSTYQAYRPSDCTAAYLTDTQFTAATATPQPDYFAATTISVPANTKFVRIKPLFFETALLVSESGGSVLQEQQHLIRSEAQDLNSPTTEVRTIEVTRQRPAPPSILDYALYSGGSLSKQ